ncbi:MAG: HEAT repeat domain-containing protein [Planctomycetes bacterium]|nr:HEAT repeat domain-containing protein [Planctomycetota bacterium]
MSKTAFIISITAVLCGAVSIGYFTFFAGNNGHNGTENAGHNGADSLVPGEKTVKDSSKEPGKMTDLPVSPAGSNADSSSASGESGNTAVNPAGQAKVTTADAIEGLKKSAIAGNRAGMEKYTLMVSRQGDAAVPYLEEMMGDPEPNVRKMGIYVLGLMKRREFEDRFIEMLKDDNPYVRATSINALTKIKSEKALPAIEELLRTDLSNDVKFSAENAIRVLKK